MGETVQGRVDATAPKRVKWGYGYFDRLVIHAPSGPRAFTKLGAAGKIRELIERGGEGTFYLSKHGGALGIHGIKMADGSKHYAHFNNHEWLYLIGAALGAGVGVFKVTGSANAPLTPIVIGVILFAVWLIVRNGRLQNKKAFDEA